MTDTAPKLTAEPTSEPTSDLPVDRADDDLLVEDLVEEVSIDGMCGVY